MGRIVDYPEITTLSAGDYLIVDNAESGTKKVSAPLVAGTVDPTPTEDSTNAVSSGGVWTSLNDISEEFDGLRTDAYDVYPKGIASGDIVQFETGADNVPLSDLTGYIYPTMSGSGMPSRTNIRTISGPDDINIYQRNKNLIEQITYQSEPETVYLGVQNSSNLTMFFKAGDYRITVNIVGGSTVVPYWSVGSTATHSEYMHLDNDTNVGIYVYDADGISASDIESFQVEVGTEATDYVEFEGDITNVVLPTDRGTIYSGRVALTAGKVYIDTVIYERNSSTMNNTEDKPGWAYTGLQTYDAAIGTFDDVIYWPNGDVRCTNVNVGSTYSIEVANEDYSLILPRDVYNMSQSQWISAGVNIQILVKLNTPIEIDIDPVEVRSLYGFNTYYCNSGKTGVIFGMDLAKYISDKTTEVQKEEQAKLEKAFATDTASGAVATFTDGADDIPMKSVKVAIEPVQDLHGYDHPWPAGGGVNLFDIDNINTVDGAYGLTTSIDGDIVRISGTFTATSGITYRIIRHGQPIIEDAKFAVFRLDTSSAIISLRYASTSDNSIVVQASKMTPNTDVDIRFKFMIYTGSTAPTSYSPYSNICPITGWTGAQVVRTGKNLLPVSNPSTTNNGITFTVNDDGSITVNGTATRQANFFCVSSHIDGFENGKTYFLSGCPNGGGLNSYALWLNNGGAVQDNGSGASFVYNRHEIVGRIRVESGTVCNNLVFRPQVELGSTATAYEPYTGNTYPITFPSEAGTVYGGELDVTNGVLTVDRAMVDLGTLTWNMHTTVEYGEYFWGDVHALGIKYEGNYYQTDYNALCSQYSVASRTQALQTDKMLCFDGSVGEVWQIQMKDSDYSDATAFKTAMSGVQLCYQLATPITYTLTPTEIKSLLGDNNVWADAGDTAVTYRADTKLYIDKKLGTDAPMIATSNIVSGSYFMIGSNLYKATANIANGAAVVVGTNAVAITMAEALNEINA